MPENPITVSLPQDLPTDWTYGQTIGPNGTDVGLLEQHGYNYLMKQVNAAQQAAKETGEAFRGLTASAIGAETPTGAQQKADAVKAGVTDGTIKAAKAAAADTAAKLAAKRTIALSGGATGTATGFDGSGNISIPVTGLDMSKATAGTLPVARGGTGSTSLDNVTVGNALKLGSVIASRFSQYHTITGDMLAYIDSQPEASTGMFASTSSATNVPPGLANGGGMGFFVKLKQYDARIFFVSHYGPNYKSYTIFKVREEWSEWHSL